MRTFLRRILLLSAALVCMTTAASAYYHWIFYAVPGGPYPAIPGRFDLNALTDNTVNYFISDEGPAALMPGDSLTAVTRQIQEAAKVWNKVHSSALRLHFGGVINVATPQSAPGIDVVFDDDMPPGILAQTRPTFPADLTFLPHEGTTFVPLLRSRVQIRKDFTTPGMEQRSYSDSFFLTVVHEFGHALGLQHTLTSGVMSTAVTRATTKGLPLAADDIAAISTLYPTANYATTVGSITGRVTLGDSGVNLASVVALSPSGAAISALTNPDGTYSIQGVPKGQYYVYVHPLPPAQRGESSPGAIMEPLDVNGQNYPAQIGFDTRFYPGTRDVTQATLIDVSPGSGVTDINFAVESRPGPVIYGMETYGYQNGIAVASPPLPAEKRQYVVFYAPGTTADNGASMAPGLNVAVIGDAAHIEDGSLRYYTQGFLIMIVATQKVDARTPVTLTARFGDELYVLPAAFTVEPTGPPSVSSVTPFTTDDGSLFATIAGANLSNQTRILFDGARAKIVAVNEDGSLVVVPPTAPSAHLAVVEAVNPDGQTSLQALDLDHLATFAYPVRDDISLQVDTPTITVGTDSMVSITGVNTHFAAGQTSVGFGTSDITVRKLWVVDATHLLMNVTVSAAAPPQPASVTVSTGLETASLPVAISVSAAIGSPASLRVPIRNSLTGLAGVPAGGSIRFATTGLPDGRDGWILLIGGRETPFTVDEKGMITADVPGDLGIGPQIVQLNTKDAPVAPSVLVQIDLPPPVILSAVDNTLGDGTGVEIGFLTFANPGDTITLAVEGLTGAQDIWLSVQGEIRWPNSVRAGDNGTTFVRFNLPSVIPYNPEVSTQSIPVMVGSETRVSAVARLNVLVPMPDPSSDDTATSAAH